MKKYGKYEKRPEGVAEKQPKVKSALLQTYLTSLLCMVLCVTMFFGTSYAWFTSEVNNVGNEIYIGTLDVELEKKLADDTWVSLSEKENDVNKTRLFDKDTRWEPGYTALETIQIVNEGDLAFKYVLSFTDGAAKDAAGQEVTLADVAKYFDVWVYDYYNHGNAAATLTTYKAITEENSGWVYAGSLDQLLTGKVVLEGNMVTVRNEATGEPVATADTYMIALHMKENADESVMGHRISLNVKLVAYQKSSETDDLGNKNYDQLVATEKDLREAIQNGGQVTLLEDIVLTEGVSVPADKAVILVLNGYKITGTATANMTSLIINNGNMTIEGDGELAIIHDGSDVNGKAVNVISNRGELIVNGGKISNTGSGMQIGYGIDNYNGATLTVNGGEITATGSGYYDGIRLFCGSNETLVTVNGGEISSIWAQNPSADKASEVKGTVILNGGEVTTTYYENYTTVKVKSDVTATVTAYGAGSDKTITDNLDGYTVYSFVH